jgi:hypothetical protein
MERAFWTFGAIPMSRLQTFAIPHESTVAALVNQLKTDGTARIGGPPGSGKTTLAHQVTAQMGQGATVISSRGLPLGTEADYKRHLSQEPWRSAKSGPAQWADFRDQIPPGALLILDDLASGNLPWAQRLAAELGIKVLIVGAEGTPPPAIDAQRATQFLVARTKSVGLQWAAPALREALALAHGSAITLQHVGHAAVNTAFQFGRTRIDQTVFEEAAFHASSLPPAQLLAAIGGLHGPRLALYRIMAQFPADSPTSWARRLGLEPKAAVVHLQRMTSQGLVLREGRGRYRPASQLLANYVRLQLSSVVYTFQAPATRPS